MRTISRLIFSAVILIVTGLLAAVAIYLPEPFFAFYRPFSREILAAIANVTGAFPFAVWEVGLVVLVLLAAFFLFHNQHLLRWLAGVVELVCVMIFLFVALWGLNHFDPQSVADQVGLDVTEYSTQQLQATTAYMAQQAENWAEQVQRNDSGIMSDDFDTWAKQANDGYEILAEENEFFAGSDAPVKKMLSGRLFSYMGTTGIFTAFTAECNINPETYSISLPFTMCHELAHRLGVAAEDEANFYAFLACLNNPDPDFQYSCWYSAFLYTYNALHEADYQAASKIWSGLSQTLQEDCRRANAHYDQYEGKVQEVANKANDTYLKVFQEESGIRSYGEVADLLIAWYLQNVA